MLSDWSLADQIQIYSQNEIWDGLTDNLLQGVNYYFQCLPKKNAL